MKNRPKVKSLKFWFAGNDLKQEEYKVQYLELKIAVSANRKLGQHLHQNHHPNLHKIQDLISIHFSKRLHIVSEYDKHQAKFKLTRRLSPMMSALLVIKLRLILQNYQNWNKEFLLKCLNKDQHSRNHCCFLFKNEFLVAVDWNVSGHAESEKDKPIGLYLRVI